MVTELWDAYSSQVFHYINKRVNDGKVAEDLLQDTFQKVLAHSERLDEVNNRKAWLFSIARNTLIDYTRKIKEQPIGEVVIAGESGEPSTFQTAAESIAACLYEIIDEYEGVDKEILLEVFTKSLSQKEASQYLEVPYSTLKSRIQKAREEIVNEFHARCCRLQYNSHGEIIGCKPVRSNAAAQC